MEEVASEEEVQMEEILDPMPSEVENRRVISMECPFQAYKIIVQHADLEYIGKLGLSLINLSQVMNTNTH